MRLRCTLSVSTVIDASADRVWEVLVDLARYPEWNPYFVSASGDVVEGREVTVGAVIGDRRPARSCCRVVTVEPDRRLRWRSRFVIPGLIDSDHTFDLVARTLQVTEFRQHETLAGLLVPVAPRGEIRSACRAMGDALRTRVEARPRPRRQPD